MSSLRDPQEDDPKIKELVEQASVEAKENLGPLPQERGNVHKQWAEMKRILKEKHNIDWKSPADMNPDSRFD